VHKGENRLLRDKRGISPVVATVILVAVTIVVAVAVAYWMGGIAGLYTRFEKMEVTTAYATYSSSIGTDGGWNVTISFKNMGSADATIVSLLVNGKLYTEYNNATVTMIDIKVPSDFGTAGLPIPVGREATIIFQVLKGQLKSGAAFTHGVNIEIKLHSAAGQDYPKTVSLE